MKGFQRIVSLALAVLVGMSVLFCASAQGGTVAKTAVVIAGSINIREQPDESAPRVGGLTLGKEVDVLETVNVYGTDWYKIPTNDGVGFITSKYARLVMGVGMVTGASTNVYTLPDKYSLPLGSVTPGDGVILLQRIEDSAEPWYMIAYQGVIGYVKAAWVQNMSMPTDGARFSAEYKKNVTVHAVLKNVPKKYRVEIAGQSFFATGDEAFYADVSLGQLKEDRSVTICVYDADGRPREQSTVTIEVDNSFGARLTAFFRFIFSGFRWGDQTVEVC